MIATRLSIYYAAYFGTVGILMPFWPKWLESEGLNAAEIGFVLAAATMVRVIANPLVAQYADRRGQRQPIMAWLAAGAVASFFLFRFADGFWPIFLVALIYFGLWSATQPLGESLTMLNAKAHGIDYGRVRLWGSITFIIAAVAAGRALENAPPALLLSLGLGGTGVLLASCLILPRTKVAISAASRQPWSDFFKDPTFVIFLLAGALIQSSHAVYYGFSTLHWLRVGYSETTIGILWAEGVVAEIVLFIYAARLNARFGAIGLLMIGAIAAVIRWTLTGLSDELFLLVIVQALHALTFGAAHLGAIFYIAETVEPSRSASAQSIYSGTVMGLALGIVISLSGPLFGAVGPSAYFAMSLMGGVAVILVAVLSRYSRKV